VCWRCVDVCVGVKSATVFLTVCYSSTTDLEFTSNSHLLAAIDVIVLQYSFSIRLQMSDMACPDSDSAKPIFRWPVGPTSRQPINDKIQQQLRCIQNVVAWPHVCDAVGVCAAATKNQPAVRRSFVTGSNELARMHSMGGGGHPTFKVWCKLMNNHPRDLQGRHEKYVFWK